MFPRALFIIDGSKLTIRLEIESYQHICKSRVGPQDVKFRSNLPPIYPFVLSHIRFLKPLKRFVRLAKRGVDQCNTKRGNIYSF